MTRSTGNVFRDLGFTPDEAERLRIRSDLLIQLQKTIRSQRLKQAEAAKLLGVTQPRVSDLMRGRIDLFSVDTLIDMLARLGIRVRLIFRSSKRSARVAYNNDQRARSGPHSRSAAAPGSPGSLPDLRHGKSSTDLPGECIRYLAVARDCLHGAARGVRPQRVRPTLALQVTTVPSQVAQEVASLHPTMTFSRTASRGSPRSPSRRLSSRISAIASAKLRRASALLKP